MKSATAILEVKLNTARNRAIDETILLTTLLTLGNYIANLFRDAAMIAEFTSPSLLILHLLLRGGLALVICITLYVFRNRVRYQWKYFLLIATGTQVFLFSIYNFGILAPGKALIIFATLLTAFAFQFRLAVGLLSLLTLSYLFTDWMFLTGQWQFGSPSGISNFVLNPITWLGQGCLVTGITIALMRMGAMQKKVMMESMKELEEVNEKLRQEEKELTALRDHLESLVEEKTVELRRTKEEMQKTNQILTDRNQAHLLLEEELNQVLKEYESKQASLMEAGKLAAIGMMTAGMAHEINNPLNFITGATHLLESETSGSSNQETYRISIVRIREAVSRTSQLVAGLNQFNRRTDRMDETCNLSAIAQNVLFIIGPEGIGKGITFDTRLPQEPVHITGNNGKLHQAVLHLFEQALRDAEPDSTIDIRMERDETTIRLTISCTPQAGSARSTNSGSRRMEALGIYIMNRIFKEHRAVLGVSQPTGGRKVWEATFNG